MLPLLKCSCLCLQGSEDSGSSRLILLHNAQKSVLNHKVANVAYNLFSFISQGVIPSKNILIGSDLFQFHPIVLAEVEAHTQAWIVSNELGYVDENLAAIALVNSDTEAFVAQRKIYENTRIELQDEMRRRGYKGRKVDSKPSLNDYKILYSAHTLQVKISTNDGILLEISREILDSHNALTTENLLKMILIADPLKKKDIEEVLKTLHYLGRYLDSSEIFN